MRKNIIKIISILCFSIVFAACSSEEEKTQSAQNTIKVGMDLKFYPFSHVGEDGKPQGFEVDIANAFGKYLGKKVEIVNINFPMLIPALDANEVDILIADMSKTTEREQKADFSDFYRYTFVLGLVNKDFAQKNNITDAMDAQTFFALPNAKFVGLSGTYGVIIPREFGVNATEVTEIGTGIVEVSKGIADVLIASNEVHNFHAANKETTIVYSGINRSSGSSFVVKKGNKELLEKANAFIKTMYEKDGLYSKIDAKYDKVIAEFLSNKDLGLEYIIYPAKKN